MVVWECVCVHCGEKRFRTSKELRHGRRVRCSQLPRLYPGSRMRDLTGRRFGRLVALYPTEQRDRKGSVVWHCRCDCGKEIERGMDLLVSGSCTSCGCRKEEVHASIGSTLHMVDGSCVEWLRARKSRSDNTSGFRGVYRRKNGRYRVIVGLQRRRYYFGDYDSFSEAVGVRLRAEEFLHEGFLVAYERWESRAKQEGGAWREENPFFFRVTKRGRLLRIQTNAEIENMEMTTGIE